MSFFNELKRRHVFRVGIAYLVVAWVIAQAVSILNAPLHLPDWFGTVVIVLLAIGFPIALVFAWAFELTPEGVKSTTETENLEPARASVSTGRKLDFVIIGALVVAVGFLVWRLYYAAPAQIAAQSTTATATSAIPTLAVLPFANLSDDKAQDYFADGLSEELLDKLANLKGLRVAGRTSSFYFKGKNEDLRVIGEKLGVENLLEGSVRKSGDQLRITAQLINAKTGYHLWSETYDRKLDDIFAIQDDISKSVATALSVALGVGDNFNIPGMTRNVAAYDEYLLGLAASHEAQPDPAAIDHIERAIALDPSFSLAQILLHTVYWHGATFLAPADAADMRRKAEDALAHARALTPNAPFVLSAEILEAVNRSDWLEADRLGKQLFVAQAKNTPGAESGDIRGSSMYGSFLASAGRVKEAISYLEQARAVNPLDGDVSISLGNAYTASGNIAAALAEYDRGRKIGGPESALIPLGFMAALASGDRAQIDKWSALMKTADPNNWPLLAKMLQFLDNRAAAPAEIRRIASSNASGNNPATAVILTYWAAYYGDSALALDLLRGIPISENGDLVNFLAFHPLMRDVRKLPGFKDIVRNLGLVDYWRKSGHWGDFCHPVGDNDFACE